MVGVTRRSWGAGVLRLIGVITMARIWLSKKARLVWSVRLGWHWGKPEGREIVHSSAASENNR